MPRILSGIKPTYGRVSRAGAMASPHSSQTPYSPPRSRSSASRFWLHQSAALRHLLGYDPADTVGRNVRVPVLFHYAENDLFFSPKVSRGWFDRFNANGANAEYTLQPAFGRDGHYLFGDTLGVRYWLPTVESFLARHLKDARR